MSYSKFDNILELFCLFSKPNVITFKDAELVDIQ